MRIAYLDCASGISGDMTLGALIDAGAPLEAIQNGVASLGLPGVRLTTEEVRKKGFRALQVRIEHEPEHAHRHLHQITEMIDAADAITPVQRELAKRIFTRLGEAEARVHGTDLRKVHFHEVGAIDSIVDIVGGAIAWDLLKVDRIVCSEVPTGGGFIQIAHGRVRVPAPATAELLRGVPLAETDVASELTTPTGAALVAALVDQFGGLPAMRIEKIGYGSGERDLEEQANLLRLFVGQVDDHTLVDQVWVLETNLDDVSGEVIGHCTARLFDAGALDVYTTAIQMKKNRPGVKVSVLCEAASIAPLEKILFQETATLGVRRWPAGRHKLARRECSVETRWGAVLGKIATLADGTESFSPEYESCRAVAEEQSLALRDVAAAARTAYEKQQ